MLEMHLKQQVFTYSPYRLFTNNNEKTKKNKTLKKQEIQVILIKIN